MAVQQAFATSFLDPPKMKLKTGVYTAGVLIVLFAKPFNSIPLGQWTLLTILGLSVVIAVIIYDFSQFSEKVLIVALYHAIIPRTSGPAPFGRNPGVASHLLDIAENAKKALLLGNWQEALLWISQFQLPDGYRMPKDMLVY